MHCYFVVVSLMKSHIGNLGIIVISDIRGIMINAGVPVRLCYLLYRLCITEYLTNTESPSNLHQSDLFPATLQTASSRPMIYELINAGYICCKSRISAYYRTVAWDLTCGIPQGVNLWVQIVHRTLWWFCCRMQRAARGNNLIYTFSRRTFLCYYH